MKPLEAALEKVINGYEKGYALISGDSGGETYCGIARNYHPLWPGWSIIDQAKKNKAFPKNLDSIPELPPLVTSFYKSEFWDKFRGDDLPQDLAVELFDIAVNCNHTVAVGFLQRALNLLNNDQAHYPDIQVDGSFGPQTLSTIGLCLKVRSLVLLINLLNILQGKFYVDIMEKKSRNEKFVGWFNRIEILKK